MAAVVEEIRACVVCGGEIPQGRRSSTCSVGCSMKARRRRQVVSVAQLRRLLPEEREEVGELAGVEWTADDCPRRRGDEGPCIHVGCRYHAAAEVTPAGSIRVRPEFEADPYSVPTCILDLVVRDGEHTLEEVGQIVGVTRERIRQIEAKALARLIRALARRGLRLEDLVTEGRAESGLAAVQGGDAQWPTRTTTATEPSETPRAMHGPAKTLATATTARTATPAPKPRPLSLPPSLQGWAPRGVAVVAHGKPLLVTTGQVATEAIEEEHVNNTHEIVNDEEEIVNDTPTTTSGLIEEARRIEARSAALRAELARSEARLEEIGEALRGDPLLARLLGVASPPVAVVDEPREPAPAPALPPPPDGGTLKERILAALAAGPMSANDLAPQIGASVDVTRAIISKLKKTGLLLRSDDGVAWRLP